MRRSVLALPLSLLAMIVSSAVTQVTDLTSLAALRDRVRPLLIFAPTPDDPQLAIQLRALHEHAAEAHERDVVPIALPYRNPGSTPAQLSSGEAEVLRRRFGIAPGDFAVILVGKDGGAKLRSRKPVAIAKLMETIDAMPMRQEEMRARAPGPTR